ncbi:protein Frey 1 [Rhineura floridana]|uniref:protein Frey 1 n=1 Tax=Rhineura floridana TaxID=261503 RepID=UPI002AC866DC|nr:protein Frey 1 [Rhineura floridana]
MGLLLLLLLLTERVLPMPSLQSRLNPSVPEEFSAPLELQQQHFGLVDDYGIKPKHPNFRRQVQRKESEKLHRVHKSKRDEPDLEEYYYDDIL